MATERPVCWICGADSSSREYEEHHVFGKKYSNVTVMLCHRCHTEVDRMALEDGSIKEWETFYIGLMEIAQSGSWKMRWALLKMQSILNKGMSQEMERLLAGPHELDKE